MKRILLALFLCSNCWAGAIAQWKMNDNALSTTVVDSVGSHNGTFKDATGDPNTSAHDSTGKINGALDLDGTDDYIEVADHADFSFGDGTDDSPFSISTWVYISNLNFWVVSKDTAGNSEWYLRFWTGKALFRNLKLDGAAHQGRIYNTALSTSQWYHIVATYDGGGGLTAHDGMKIYIDGVRKDDVDSNNGTYVAMDNGTAPVYIGRLSTDYADGLIDNVIIYNTELTQTQVTGLYNAGAGTENTSFDKNRRERYADRYRNNYRNRYN